MSEETLLRVARAQGAHEERQKVSEELRLLRAWAKADIQHWNTASPPETWSQREAARTAVREFYGSNPENDSLRVGLVPVDEEVRSAERRKIRADLLAYINAWGTGDPYRWGDEVQGDDLRAMVDIVVPEVRG